MDFSSPSSPSKNAGASPSLHSATDAALITLIAAGGPTARAAAAEFMVRHQSLIRRRLRHKLSASARRLFDSEDLFSTVARRIDQEVERSHIDLASERQFWSLIRRIGENCITDRIRDDAAWKAAQAPLTQVLTGRARDESLAEEDRDRLTELKAVAAPGSADRQMLRLWLLGTPLSTIGAALGLSDGAARKRWQRFRARASRRVANR